jgi:hypothetical protein
VITDDQVATLLRDAGTAGPVPAPVDGYVVAARARAQHARRRAAAGGGAAVALLAIGVTVATSSGTGGSELPLTSFGPASRQQQPGDVARTVVLVGGVLALLTVLTLLGRRTAPTSLGRSVLAAIWGLVPVVLVLLAGPYTSYLLLWGAVVASPQTSTLTLCSVITVVTAVCAWIPVHLRLRLLGPRDSSLVATGWLVLSLVAGQAIAWIALLRFVGARQQASPVTVVSAAAVVVLAMGAGWLRARRRGEARPVRWGLGSSVLLVGSTAAVIWWDELGSGALLSSHWRLWSEVVALGLLPAAVAGSGAWLVVARGPRRPLRAALVAAVALLVVAAAQALHWLIWYAAVGAPRSSTGLSGYLVWAVVLAVAATAALVAYDRRSAAEDDEHRPDG